MISANELGPELLDLGRLLGLIDEGGGLNSAWFESPLTRLESIVSDATQRAALLRLLDALLPPASLPGVPDDEKWHPLLGDRPGGNLYLTVKSAGGRVLLGVGGDFGHAGGPGLGANLRAQLPLVSAASHIQAVAGTSAGPFKVELTIHLGWVRNSVPTSTQPIGLEAIVLSASITPPSASLVITLKKLALDERPPQDTVLNPEQLGSQAVQLILGLLKQNLRQVTGAAGAEAVAVRDHLLPLLGLAGEGIPPFPFAQLFAGPTALQNWFGSLLQGSTPPIAAWLGHLGGLIGATGPTVSGAGTETNPWRVQVIPFDARSGLSVTVANGTGSLKLGLATSLVPGASTPVARVEAQATLAALPLNGTAVATVLPAASVTFRAPGGLSAPNLVSDAHITVGSLRGGLRWNGSALQPMLELDEVTLEGTHYARLDLTNADSVVAAASAAVQTAIRNALGTGAGSQLAALAGLIAPSGDATSTHLIDPALLVSNPARAIAAVHRAVLLDSTHNWSFMLAEIAGLLGITGGVSGAGTQSDPWRVSLGPASTIDVELAAWNAQTPGAAADPQQLRLGLRASASSAPMEFSWLAELLAFDLPATGEGSVGLMAGQHASLLVQPAPRTPPAASIVLGADSFTAEMNWSPGSSMAWQAAVNNLSLTLDGTTVNVPALRFPAAAGFDVSNPAATAASFGVSIPNLELLLRALLARAALSWGEMEGFTLAGLLGVHKGLDGFQSDWPALADPGAAGSLLSDPFNALRQWLSRVAVELSADGSPFLPEALSWLRALLSDALPDGPSQGLPDVPVEGAGTYEEPWALPLLAGNQSADALVWLEPSGPPSSWAGVLTGRANEAVDFSSLLDVAQSLSAFSPAVKDALGSLDAEAQASAVELLDNHLTNSDGVVPLASQVPTGATWTAGTPVSAAHHLQPKDPSAITQILAQVDTLAGGVAGARAVLLIGPAFNDHTSWQDLLAHPDRHGTTDPAAHFNLRVAGLSPDAVDLGAVTTVADYYTADLQDDGDVIRTVGEIGRVAARIGALRPGVPLTLVAHSTAGVAARIFTAANPAAVRGLITLGTPHKGATLPFLTDPAVADATRLVQGFRSGMSAPSPLRDALDHIFQALDGFIAPAAAGALPTQATYPVASFAGTIADDTGGRPALAIGGTLGGSLLDLLKQAAAALATNAAASARPAPTHLCFGVRARLLPPSSANDVSVDASLRGDAFRVRLLDGAAEPPRPAHTLGVEVRLSRPGGWLVGAASAFAGIGLSPVDVRVREAEFGVVIQAGAGGVRVTPGLTLRQAGYHGPTLSRVELSDARAQALLGAVMQAITVPAPAATTQVSGLIDVLQALHVVVRDPHEGFGISADAFAAIMTDAASFFGARLQAALDAGGGLAGLRGPAGGPWTLTIDGLPLEISLSSSPWRLGLRTTPVGAGALSLGGAASLSFGAEVALPAFTTSLDATLKVGGLSLSYEQATRQLILRPPCLPSLRLLPTPSASELAAALNELLPRLLFSSSAGALLQALTGPGIQLGPLDCFLSATGNFLQSPSSLGNEGGGGGLDASKVSTLLQVVNQLAGFPEGPGLQLPAGFQLTATGAGANAVTLSLGTTAPIGGVLGVALTATIDRQLHVRPGGTLSLTTPLTSDAEGANRWTAVTLTFGADEDGVSLVVAPQTVPPIAPLQILPTFSGLGALLGSAEALLPAALDRVVSSLSTPGPRPQWLTHLLSVTEALGLYDNAGHFAAHAADLRALLEGDWLSLFDPARRANVATAVAALINGIGALPAAANASGSTVNWSFPLGGADAGTVGISVGWDGSGPVATLTAASVKLGGGAVTFNLSAGYGGGAIRCSTDLALSLRNALHVDVAPKLSVGFSGGGNHFNVNLLPLATTTADGPLRIELAPTPGLHAGASAPGQFVEHWLLPLTADLTFEAFRSRLANPVWTGGPALRDVLAHAHLIVKGATPAADHLNSPLPDVQTMLVGLLTGLAGGGVAVNVSSTLTLHLVESGGRFGVRLSGHEDFNAGEFRLSMRFGAPHAWTPSSGTGASLGADFGVALFLFETGAGDTFVFNPGLFVAGLGLGLSNASDGPLIDTSGFRMGAVRLYIFFDVELRGGLTVQSLGAGLELDGLGLPLGLATGGNVGGNNPVAANLLRSDSNSGGDAHPVNPGVDVSAWYWSAPAGDDRFHILFGGQSGTLWIGVHRGFGPIYIDQVGLEVSDAAVGLLIDGSVKVDGLTAQVDDLTVRIPYRSILDPSQWSLDLRGLAIGFKSPGVTVAGGLMKSDGPPVEYDGMLLIQITQFGFVAVGAYSTPTDALTGEQYTSLFVFAGVFIVIGIPPIIQIEGLGLGVGYNRQLLVPEDLNQVPNFVLISALDDGGAIANDPMGTLRRIREQMPAKRGSFWLAVGLRGSSFVIVHVTAVVYVALDRGVEVGLVGVARMALPSDDSALVSVELALKARFSTADGTLSIRAQLTDNSWLLSRDCQLTGGFAYFAWFQKSQFLLTLGGYHPAFHRPPEFPEVPRIGYHWSFLGVVQIKGETYFALTNSCVMAGTRMEATYGPSWLQVWFTAYTDFLVSWDPFFYDIRIGIEVGARFRIRICFFGCVTIHISVSLGADLRIQGPPLHGTVTVDLAVASVTVAFGPDPDPRPNYIGWTDFKDKYLRAGDPVETAVTTHVLDGLLPPEPPGGQPAPGTESQPWKMAAEFTFQTETRMPATRHRDFVEGAVNPDTSLHHDLIDLAPMGKESVTSEHVVILEGRKPDGGWHLMVRVGTDERFRIHPDRFTVERLVGQVSEATYHFIDHDHIPAAANTLPVITGIRIKGFAILSGESAVVPWAKLIDSGFSRPLPFATLTGSVLTILQSLGAAAEALGTFTASASSQQTIEASMTLLSGGGFFSEARDSAGLPSGGLTPLAVRSLERYRSAPPLITPITTGLTMRPVGQEPPPAVARVETVLPVALDAPRLRATLQSRPLPIADAPPAVRTTVTKSLRAMRATVAANIPRMAAPQLTTVAGARLEIVRAANAPRPTTLACSGRTLRSAELGWSAGGAHTKAFADAERLVVGVGVTLPAGTTHIWELPKASGRTMLIEGEAAVRVTCLTRGGRILTDHEETAHRGTVVSVPDECGMVAVTCLGRVASGAELSGGLGAVSFSVAPYGSSAVVGWQTGNLLPQVGSSALLGRGACLLLPQPYVPLKGKQRTTQSMLRVSDAMVEQQGAETWLPTKVGVVGVLLDQQDTCAAVEGDFSIAATGAKLQTPPLRVEGGRRKLLLYDVAELEEGAGQIVVSVASREGSRFAGVVGLPGRAQEWAARMNGGVPEHLVPDGPLTPDGEVSVRINLKSRTLPKPT